MGEERIAEIRAELATLREELRQAKAAQVPSIINRIDVLLAELVAIGRKIVSPMSRSN